MKKIALLILLIFLSGCSTIVAEIYTSPVHLTTSQQTARQLGERLNSYSGNHTISYCLGEEFIETYMFSSPVRYKNITLKEKDNQYVSNGDYRDVFIPSEISDDSGILIQKGENSVEIFPDWEGKYNGKLENKNNIYGEKVQTVVYKNMFGKGTELKCYPTTYGIGFEIMVDSLIPNAFKLKMKIPQGANLDTEALDYATITDFEGNEKVILNAPLVNDSAGKWQYDNNVNVEQSEIDEIYVEYNLNKEFLNNSETKYPITISFSISVYEYSQPDTSVYSNISASVRHYLSPFMLIGQNTVKGEGYAFIRYEGLQNMELEPEKILKAEYVFRSLFDSEIPIVLGIYAVSNDWCSINTFWNNKPPVEEIPIKEIVIKRSGDYKIDITEFFKEIVVSNEKIRYGFMIKSTTQNSNIIIPSGDNGILSPLLIIKYQNNIGG